MLKIILVIKLKLFESYYNNIDLKFKFILLKND